MYSMLGTQVPSMTQRVAAQTRAEKISPKAIFICLYVPIRNTKISCWMVIAQGSHSFTIKRRIRVQGSLLWFRTNTVSECINHDNWNELSYWLSSQTKEKEKGASERRGGMCQEGQAPRSDGISQPCIFTAAYLWQLRGGFTYIHGSLCIQLPCIIRFPIFRTLFRAVRHTIFQKTYLQHRGQHQMDRNCF